MEDNTSDQNTQQGPFIKIVPCGPYLVTGSVPLKEKIITPIGGHQEYHEGRVFETTESYALCRCGHTKTPPFCDGTHATINFKGHETASRESFSDRADLFVGEGVDLLDDNRCAFARFCHRDEGDVWSLTDQSGDPHLRDEAIKASTDCPTGRLVHLRKEDGSAIEPACGPEICLLQDPTKGVSGGIFVKGNIPLESADGTFYELRNRYTLCRCGESRDKPFCDAFHIPSLYHDHLSD